MTQDYQPLWRACAESIGVAPRDLTPSAYLAWLHTRRRAYVAAHPDRVRDGHPVDADHWAAFAMEGAA